MGSRWGHAFVNGKRANGSMAQRDTQYVDAVLVMVELKEVYSWTAISILPELYNPKWTLNQSYLATIWSISILLWCGRYYRWVIWIRRNNNGGPWIWKESKQMHISDEGLSLAFWDRLKCNFFSIHLNIHKDSSHKTTRNEKSCVGELLKHSLIV